MNLIKKYKNIIFAFVIIAALLTAAFVFGGDDAAKEAESNEPTSSMSADKEPSKDGTSPEKADASQNSAETAISEKTENKNSPEQTEAKAQENKTGDQAEKSIEYSEKSGMDINPKTGTDEHGTEPVPVGKPVPVESQQAEITDTELTCTLSVRCDNAVGKSSEKAAVIPTDGVIFPEQKVVFHEGESVFNVLVREMKKNKIHLEFVNTPVYNSAYIEGISNLYEFDCGERSGWMYKVNGWFPNYGCSRYELKNGDKIEWVYTCDLGRDVGGDYSARNGSQNE